MLRPFGREFSSDLLIKLSEQVEIAVRAFARCMADHNNTDDKRFQQERHAEFKRVANDPARALGSLPDGNGGRDARNLLLTIAAMRNIDPETRVGAIAIGDIAQHLTDNVVKVRSDIVMTIAEEELFTHLCDAAQIIEPTAFDALPSNETVDETSPIIDFAMSFTQVAIDRSRERKSNLSHKWQKRSDAILNKSPRMLLKGIRERRQFLRDPMFEDTMFATGTILGNDF